METVLKCESISKKFGKRLILKDVSLELKKGDILGFIGPYDVQKNFTKAIEKVGAIVENPDMYMYLSGYQNLKLVANLYKNVDKKRIDEVVKLVKLENRINDKVSKYSLRNEAKIRNSTSNNT